MTHSKSCKGCGYYEGTKSIRLSIDRVLHRNRAHMKQPFELLRKGQDRWFHTFTVLSTLNTILHYYRLYIGAHKLSLYFCHYIDFYVSKVFQLDSTVTPNEYIFALMCFRLTFSFNPLVFSVYHKFCYLNCVTGLWIFLKHQQLWQTFIFWSEVTGTLCFPISDVVFNECSVVF